MFDTGCRVGEALGLRLDHVDTSTRPLHDVRAQQAMTTRHVFYRCVGFERSNKTEIDYKNVVCRLVAEMWRGDVR